MRLWWIAVVVTLSTSVFATAAVVAIGFATVTLPAGLADAVINFAINLVIVTVTFALAEEVGFRGYLLPRLSALTRNRALAVTGLVHAAWHLPLIFLTPLYHSDGSMLIVLPLFVGTIVAAGFFCGDLRLATGSVWPASIAHAVHNVAWGLLAGFTVASAPVLVEEYLSGDNGAFVLLTTVVAAVWLRWWLRRRAAGSDQAEGPRLPYGVLAGDDAELAVEALGVALDRVDRQVECGADLALGGVAGQRAQDGLFAVGQLLDQGTASGGRPGSRRGRRAARRLPAGGRTAAGRPRCRRPRGLPATPRGPPARSCASSSTSARLVSAVTRAGGLAEGAGEFDGAAQQRSVRRRGRPSRWASWPSTVRSRAIPGAVAPPHRSSAAADRRGHVGEQPTEPVRRGRSRTGPIARMLAACRPSSGGRPDAPAPGPTRRRGTRTASSGRSAKASIAPRTVRATT